MKFWSRLFKRLTEPGPVGTVISLVSLAFVIASTVIMLNIDYKGTYLEVVAYICFAMSAVLLAYTVYMVVITAPNMKKYFTDRIESNRLLREMLHNWGFRTLVTSTVSFAMSVFSSVTNAYLGIVTKSLWFGALAAYYIFLALMRSELLIYHRRKRNFEDEALIRARKYTRCGVLLLILNVALSSAIAQMIFDDRAFEYKDWLIYAFATYAFYKVFMSVRNVIKARRQDDLTIQAIREINLVDAAVSILALQTALLHTFSDGSANISLFNTLTGCFVSAFSLSLSVYMIIKGNKTIKEIKRKNAEG